MMLDFTIVGLADHQLTSHNHLGLATLVSCRFFVHNVRNVEPLTVVKHLL